MEELTRALARDLPEILGRNIHLSVDLGFLLRERVLPPARLASFSEELLYAVLSLVGPTKSVMVSTFNFDFGTTKRFDVQQSKSQVGRFSQISMENPLGIRTASPFYSFKVFGTHTQTLEPYPFRRCTGEKSPFDFQIKHHYLLIAIGHHINKALTLVHHSENIAGVSWRYEKIFEGLVKGLDKLWQPAETSFFVRKDGVLFSGLTIEGDEHFRLAHTIGTRTVSLGHLGVPVEFGEVRKIHEDLVWSLSQKETRLSAPILKGRPNPGVITAKIADRLFANGVVN